VPDAVRWRAGKGQPGLHVTTALRRNRAVLDDLFVRDPSVLEPYVDVDVLRNVYTELVSERPIHFKTVVRLWSAAALGMWLRHVSQREAAPIDTSTAKLTCQTHRRAVG